MAYFFSTFFAHYAHFACLVHVVHIGFIVLHILYLLILLCLFCIKNLKKAECAGYAECGNVQCFDFTRFWGRNCANLIKNIKKWTWLSGNMARMWWYTWCFFLNHCTLEFRYKKEMVTSTKTSQTPASIMSLTTCFWYLLPDFWPRFSSWWNWSCHWMSLQRSAKKSRLRANWRELTVTSRAASTLKAGRIADK